MLDSLILRNHRQSHVPAVHWKSIGVAFANYVTATPRDLPFTRQGYGFNNGNGGNVVRDAYTDA